MNCAQVKALAVKQSKFRSIPRRKCVMKIFINYPIRMHFLKDKSEEIVHAIHLIYALLLCLDDVRNCNINFDWSYVKLVADSDERGTEGAKCNTNMSNCNFQLPVYTYTRFIVSAAADHLQKNSAIAQCNQSYISWNISNASCIPPRQWIW